MFGRFNDGFLQCYSSVISHKDQIGLNARYYCMFKALLWLFSPAWDTVQITLIVGSSCPFSSFLLFTLFLARPLPSCLTSFDLSAKQKTNCACSIHNFWIIWSQPSLMASYYLSQTQLTHILLHKSHRGHQGKDAMECLTLAEVHFLYWKLWGKQIN